MELLVFAHRGEAQAFLSQIKFQAIEDSRLQLFESENLDLLITGEGYLEALKSCLLTLGKKKYDNVINFGIAGALSPGLELGKITSVRTIYRYFNETPIFKSHTSSDTTAKYDCTSFNKRVLDPIDAKNLSIHAHLVDRELWGIAEACKIFDTSIISYKLISDIAGKTNCELVADKAVEYTHQLYDYFVQKRGNKYQSSSQLTDEAIGFIRSLSPTFSQRVQLESLLLKCQLKKIRVESIYDLEIYTDWPRKKRNQKIIKKLTAIVDPIQSRLDQLCSEFSTIHCKATPHSEQPTIEVRAKIANKEQLKLLIKELELLPIEKISSFYNGEL